MRIVCIIITIMNQRILQYSALSSTVGLHALAFALMGGAVAMQAPITLPRVASMEMISLAAPSKAASPAAPKQQPKPEKKPTPQVKPTPTPKPTPVKPKVMATPTPAAPSAKAISVPTAAPAAESKPSPAASSAEGGSSRGQSADAKPSITEPMYRGGYLNNPKPAYPALSIEEGETGTVQLRVHVSAQGQPLEVTLSNSSGFPRLDRAAVAAVKKWTFTPAKRGNEAIAYTFIVPVEFSLKSAKS